MQCGDLHRHRIQLGVFLSNMRHTQASIILGVTSISFAGAPADPFEAAASTSVFIFPPPFLVPSPRQLYEQAFDEGR
jgi:hypothetical protein